MTIFKNSNGLWVFYDGKVSYSFNTEEEAKLKMYKTNTSEIPIEEELIIKITTEILPKMRELIILLNSAQLAWQDNNVSQLIDEAKENNKLVSGFTPETWELWGFTFLKWQEWLETELPELGGTKPRSIIMRRYVAQEDILPTLEAPFPLPQL